MTRVPALPRRGGASVRRLAWLLAALEGLGRELVDLLVMAFLERRSPPARPAAALLTVLEPAEERQGNAPVVQNGRLVRDCGLDLLGVHARAFSDPCGSVHKVYALCKSPDDSAGPSRRSSARWSRQDVNRLSFTANTSPV